MIEDMYKENYAQNSTSEYFFIQAVFNREQKKNYQSLFVTRKISWVDHKLPAPHRFSTGRGRGAVDAADALCQQSRRQLRRKFLMNYQRSAETVLGKRTVF